MYILELEFSFPCRKYSAVAIRYFSKHFKYLKCAQTLKENYITFSTKLHILSEGKRLNFYLKAGETRWE